MIHHLKSIMLFNTIFKQILAKIGLSIFLLFIMFFSCGCRKSAEELKEERQRAEYIKKIKGYVSEGVLKTVAPEFYTYPGFYDWYRFPLVYPYSIHTIDGLDYGSLIKDDDESKISGGVHTSIIRYVTHLCFDANYLLARVIDERPGFSATYNIYWVLFEFKNGKWSRFKTEEELFKEALNRGYAEERELLSTKEQFYKCFSSNRGLFERKR